MSADALILAAGGSTRMKGGFKPLLALGDESVLARQIRLFREAGCGRVVVVAGNRAGEVAAEARRSGAEASVNPDPDRGMFSSVVCGAEALSGRNADFFVMPVDIPLVRLQTVKHLLAARQETPRGVLHPVFRGERGHPPLLPPELKEAIAAYAGPGGLAGCLAAHGQAEAEVPVSDPHILLDMDTDEDYAAMVELLAGYDVPSREECLEIMALRDNVNERGLVHSIAVTRFALAIARALNKAGNKPRLDLDVVEAAGLLHDVAKGFPRHELEGGRLLRGMGFHRLAGIVAAHRDIDHPPEAPITEREVVYFADKLAQGPALVRVEERFGAKLRLHGHDPEAAEAIKGRMGRALAMRDHLERAMGLSLAELLGEPERVHG